MVLIEWIECPQCGLKQTAEAIFEPMVSPLWQRHHICEQCGYQITGDEWKITNPILNSNKNGV